MSDLAIRVEGLGKRYRIGVEEDRPETLFGAAMNLLKAPLRSFRDLRKLKHFEQEEGDDIIWAVRDVSFEVQKGEVVGVIGHNGAGKSTFLKLLSRITDPTTGYVDLYGRVASLLEVGTGFHPELTGRENVYLNGTLLGMRKEEVDEKFDEIVDFSGVTKFIDTPVKRYSSGMKVRLGFAVAAHLEPEILLIDEVLAVGDVAFRRKCLSKMDEVARSGRTVLFVSHNMEAITTLTERCILMSGGRVVFDGASQSAVDEYLKLGATEGAMVYSDEEVGDEPKITRIELDTTNPGNVQQNGEPMTIHLDVFTPRPIPEARIACQVISAQSVPVALFSTVDREIEILQEPGHHRISFRVPNVRLHSGDYTLTVTFAQALHLPKFQRLTGLCPFEVVYYGQERDVPRYQKACVYVEDFDVEAGRAGAYA